MSGKKIRIYWLFLCICVVVLSGCNHGEKMKTENELEVETKVNLVLWSYFETQAQREGLNRLVRDFNQSQNKYIISWEYVPMTDFTNRLSSAFTENALPDMAILDNPDMPMMIQLGLFEDITDTAKQWNLDEKYYPATLETVCFEGHYYGVPFDCNNTALIYNKTLLAQEGLKVPLTWQELRTAAKQLTKENRTGFLMCAMEGEQGAFQILSWILAAEAGEEYMTQDAVKQAFGFFKSLLEDGSLSEQCINFSQTDVAREFAAGKVAMIQDGPWVFPMLDEAEIDYAVVPIPGINDDVMQSRTVAGGENIGILKGKNVEGSLAFIYYIIKNDLLTEFCADTGVLPGCISAAESIAEEQKRMCAFQEQMQIAVPRSSIKRWTSVKYKLTEGMYSLVAQEKTPEEIARELFDEVN